MHAFAHKSRLLRTRCREATAERHYPTRCPLKADYAHRCPFTAQPPLKHRYHRLYSCAETAPIYAPIVSPYHPSSTKACIDNWTRTASHPISTTFPVHISCPRRPYASLGGEHTTVRFLWGPRNAVFGRYNGCAYSVAVQDGIHGVRSASAGLGCLGAMGRRTVFDDTSCAPNS